MSATERNRTVYYGPYAFDTVNTATLYKPGELGTVVIDVAGDRRGQIVQLDSGCTSATPTGVVAAGQAAFWKDKIRAIVTNDASQANAVNAPAGGWSNGGNVSLDARNFLAGVFQLAVTAGNYTIILQRSNKSAGYSVKSTSTPNAGDVLVANTGNNADFVNVAAGTAPTTSKALGTVTGPGTGTTVPCWVNLPEED